MQIAQDVYTAGIAEETGKCHRAFPRNVRYHGASTIHRPVEDGVEVSGKDRGDCWVDPIRNVIKKCVSVWIAVRSVYTSNAKGDITKGKLHKRKRPESSDCDETKEKHGRNRMMQPQDLWVPGEETYE